jgi:hypothetical protein
LGLHARFWALAALGLACACSLLAFPGHARAEQTAAEKCTGELFLYELVAYGVGTTMSPPNGGEAPERSAVTFSAESPSPEPEPGKQEQIPISFEVGTAIKTVEGQEVVANDLVSGAGSPSAGTNPGGTRWSFTTSKATGNRGTIYWQASFTRNLTNCNGGKGEKRTFTSSALGGKPHSLTVIPVSEQPLPIPHEECGVTTTCTPPVGALGVRITASQLLHIGHPAVAYLIGCTVQCTGQTDFQAWQLRGRHKPGRMRALDFGPRTVSIAGPSGGNQRFVAYFRGRALKKLRSALRGGHEVKLVVGVKVKDQKGDAVSAQRVILLKR